MNFDPQNHRRRSIRLGGYDYTLPGAYFVTLCTWKKECLFGEVVEEEMQFSPEGKFASEQWVRLSRRFPWGDFSTFIIMPNHVHGIVMIQDQTRRGAGEDSQNHGMLNSPLRPYIRTNVTPGSLGSIVRTYKASVTYRIHALRGSYDLPIWQRNYYEHIIRDEPELQRIADYIRQNPANWEQDQLHPNAR